MKHKTNISVRNNRGVYVIPRMILGMDGKHTSGDVFDANAIDKITTEIRNKDYAPEDYSGLGRTYLKKNMQVVGQHFNRFVISVPFITPQSLNDSPDEIVYEKKENRFVGIKRHYTDNGESQIKYYISWIDQDADIYIHPIEGYNYVCDVDNKCYVWKNGKLVEDKNHETTNIFVQDMMNKPGTIYNIGYDYDLGGQQIVVPDGCTLNFTGGSFRNGTLVLNDTIVYPDYNQLIRHKDLNVIGNAAIGTYWFDNTENIPLWWDGVNWIGFDASPHHGVPQEKQIIYYGFAPAQLIGIDGLDSVETSSIDGTYITYNQNDGNQYFMIIPNKMIIASIMDTLNFPMALQGIVEIDGKQYNRYISTGSELGYRKGEYEFHCSMLTQ